MSSDEDDVAVPLLWKLSLNNEINDEKNLKFENKKTRSISSSGSHAVLEYLWNI